MTISTTPATIPSTAAISRRCDGENQDEAHHRALLISAGVCEALAVAMSRGGEHREVAYYSAAAASALAEGGDASALAAKARLMDPPPGAPPRERRARPEPCQN